MSIKHLILKCESKEEIDNAIKNVKKQIPDLISEPKSYAVFDISIKKSFDPLFEILITYIIKNISNKTMF